MKVKIYNANDVLKQQSEEPDYQSSAVEDEIVTNQNLMATVQAEYNYERDLVNQLLGQAQMANAFAQFSKTVLTSKLAFVKENKLYRAIAGKKNQDGLEFSGTWEEFCNLLGWTPEHANESIANLNSFGEEALESMSRMGIGYRELRQYRRLPENEKIALIELAKIGDKESLVEFAEEIFTKHTKEKEELKKKVDDTQADYNALQKRNTDISKEKEEMGLKLNKYELKTIPLDERLEPLKVQITQTQAEVDTLFNEYRQHIEMMEKLQFEAMENDPNYDPEAPFQLPEALHNTLLILNGALVITLSQTKRMYKDLWDKFGDEIETAGGRFDQVMSDIRTSDM
ncbi:hypothetical protein EKN56_04650 [Limnobaculum zhutongyuii]|uniref:Uncharacterized protein n=1 Tax=Limnobaculum zhutongyuii TaxID=2498113 RepID=A0A411WHI4_9GAMM|nr:hypothetical protein [Limnobaculum zhutongyuii]QBH95751.1 hypothetical protein EKN56_04650 [Limnobaculum zhutongyuii]TQS86134.1 hypothetical protein ELQ32_20310 [Limnobaculum zhutongyuii]